MEDKLLKGALFEPTVVVDFDDTICVTDHFPSIGKPKRGVREALKKIQDKGYKIVVHSVRTASYWNDEKDRLEPQTDMIIRYLDDNKIPYDYLFLGDKPIALYYIDDKAIRFDNNWDEIVEQIDDAGGKVQVIPIPGWLNKKGGNDVSNDRIVS